MIKGSAYVKRSRLPWGHQHGRLYVQKKTWEFMSTSNTLINVTKNELTCTLFKHTHVSIVFLFNCLFIFFIFTI